jgi:hypothetical protein
VALQDEENKQRQIGNVITRSLPSDQELSDKPFEITEDVYQDTDNIDTDVDIYDDLDTEDFEDDAMYELTPEEDQAYIEYEDAMYDVTDAPDDLYDMEQQDQRNSEPNKDAMWEPKTFAQYQQEESGKDFEIDWLGAKDNSFVVHAAEWINQKFDEDYVPENSIEGRTLVMQELDLQLQELGNVNLTDYKGIRTAKSLWDQRYKLQLQNQMDQAMMDSELPSINEFVNMVKEDPVLFGKQMLQEIVNKPELIFLPQIAAARAGLAATNAAIAIGATARMAQVAKVVGAGTGAYAGGVTLGTLDRIATQSTKTGEIDTAKAFEQAQIDGLLGIVTSGGATVLTRGLSKAKDFRAQRATSRTFASETAGSTEVDLDVAKDRNAIDVAMKDEATETYVDGNGNVYTFEIRETQDVTKFTDRITELKTMKKRYLEDEDAMGAIDGAMKIEQGKLKQAQLQGSDSTQIIKDMKSLSNKGEQLSTKQDIAEQWNNLQERSPVITQNFMQFADSTGVEHTLRRLTPELLKDGNVRIQGISSLDLTGRLNLTEADNKFKHAFKDYAVSATAGIQKLADRSPTAKLLLDLVDPRSGPQGRAPVETIQERTHYKQGEYAVRSNDLANIIVGKEEALRKHMRGVEVSEDPTVLEVAAGYRQLLDEARDYSTANGLKVDQAKNFLPRYYDRSKLKSVEAQADLADRVGSIVDKEGVPKYDREQASRSARDIAMNINKESDESGRFIKGSATQPVGFRKWKDVPDALLDDYLDDNFIGSIDRYLMNNAKRTELDAVFGYNGKKLTEMLNTIDKEVEGTGRFVEERERTSVEDLYKLLNGTYGGTVSEFKGVTDTLIGAQNALKLPLVTITSALEPTTMLFRLNEGNGLQNMMNAYGGNSVRKLFGSMKLKEINREAREVGLINEAAVKERVEAMTGEGLEGLPAKINNGVMKSFGLHQWTEHTRAVVYEASRNDLVRSIKGLQKNPDNTASKSRRRWLAENNIDPDLAVKWLSEGSNVNDPFYTSLKRGAARMANTMIANPNKINKAKLLSSNRSALRLAGQFKSFTSTFSNEVMKPTMDDAVKLWNEGNKGKAMQKMSTMFTMVSAMSYWATYKTSLLMEGEATGDDKPAEVVQKMLMGVAGMVIPGAAMAAPIYGGTGLDRGLGPTYSDATNLLKGNNPKLIAPTYMKAIEAVQ